METRVGLIGFGRAGQAVAGEILKEPGFDLRWVLRKTHRDEGHWASHLVGLEVDRAFIGPIERASLSTFWTDHPVDVVVDFSTSAALLEYGPMLPKGVKLVSAISHYSNEEIRQLEGMAERSAILWSPNITLGVNFLLVVSQILQDIAPWADIEIVEEHFREKAGVSGTALKIAAALGLDPKRHVNSVRVGGIVGRHEVIFGLPNQTIRLVHESTHRKAFGQGAIFAIRGLEGKEPGVYSMENLVISRLRASKALSGELGIPGSALTSRMADQGSPPAERTDKPEGICAAPS